MRASEAHAVLFISMCSFAAGSMIQSALRGGSSPSHDVVHTNVKSSKKLKSHFTVERTRKQHSHQELGPRGKAAVEHALDQWQRSMIKGTARYRRDRAPALDAETSLPVTHINGGIHFLASLSGAKQGRNFETLSYCRQCLCDLGLGANKDCVYELETVDWQKLPSTKLDYLATCIANVPCCDCKACDDNWSSSEYPRDKDKGLECSDACDKCEAMDEPGSTEDPPTKEEVEAMHPGPEPLEVWEVHLGNNVAVQWAEENCIPKDEEQPKEFNDFIGNKLTCLMKIVGPARAYNCACEDGDNEGCSKRDDAVGSSELAEFEVEDGPPAKALVVGDFSGGDGPGWYCSPPGNFSVMGNVLFSDLDHVLDEILPVVVEDYAEKAVKRIEGMSASEANDAVKKMTPKEATLVSIAAESEGRMKKATPKILKEIDEMKEDLSSNQEKAAKIVEKAKEKKEKADAKFQDSGDLEGESIFAKKEAKALAKKIKSAKTKVANMETEANGLDKEGKALDKKSSEYAEKAEKMREEISEKKEAASEEEKLDVLKSLEKDGQVATKIELKAKFAKDEAKKKEEAAAKMEDKINKALEEVDKAEERLADVKEDSTSMKEEAEKKKEESDKLTDEANADIEKAEKLSDKIEDSLPEIAKAVTEVFLEAADTLPKDEKLNGVEFKIAQEVLQDVPVLYEAFKGGFAMVVLDTNEDGLVDKKEMETALAAKLGDVLKAE